jgi:hypothetical protein
MFFMTSEALHKQSKELASVSYREIFLESCATHKDYIFYIFSTFALKIYKLKSIIMKRLILTLAVLGSFNVLNAQLPSYVPTLGLEGWWSFAGNAKDLSSFSRDGIVTGAKLSTDRFGAANSAYLFNGTSDYISVPSTGITKVTYSTVSAWVKYTGDAGGTVFDSYFQFGNWPGNTIGLSYEYSNKRFNLYRNCKATLTPAIDINNAWHHLVVVQDSLINKLYIDGALVDSNLSSSINCYGGTNMIFLGASPTNNQFVTGSLDDVGFWTRALTECEVLSLYNSNALGFSLQPIDKTGFIGGSVSFTCSATVPSATYQWQSNIGTAGAYVNLTNTGQYSGVGTNTLNVSGLTAANNLQKFRCVINNLNSACSKTSDSASITITNLAIKELHGFDYSLEQNKPNPTNGNTLIEYTIGNFTNGAELLIYDMIGRKVISQTITKPGLGSLLIQQGELKSGIYCYTLLVDGVKLETKKMIIN